MFRIGDRVIVHRREGIVVDVGVDLVKIVFDTALYSESTPETGWYLPHHVRMQATPRLDPHEVRDTLLAVQGAFMTPLCKLQMGGHWNEYMDDAWRRVNNLLRKL